jgi:hypothetical protein
VALSALMRVPAECRAELHAEALQRIARSGENDYRRSLLVECLEAYANLDEAQRQRLQELVATERYQDARPFMITTYERGRIEERRETALLLLEKRFGALSAEAKQRLEGLSPDQLRQLVLDLFEGRSLQELHLAD